MRKFCEKTIILLLAIPKLAFAIDLIPDSLLSFNKGEEVIIQQGNSELEKLPRKSKVLVWNIYKGRKETFIRKFNENAKNKNLILLQEFNNEVADEKIGNLNEKNEISYASTFKAFGKNKSGVATLSQAKSQSQTFQMSDGIAGIIPPKVALFTTYKIQSTSMQLLVINIHAKNLATNATYQKQINNVFKKILYHHGPVLFAGDFNSWSTDRFEYIKTKLLSADMKMIKFEIDNRMKAPIVSKYFDYFDYPLDNVYYKGFTIKNAQSFSQDDGSDHGAMSFDIEFTHQSLKKLRNLRPGGSGNYYETAELTHKSLKKIEALYDLNSLNPPTEIELQENKRKNFVLPGMRFLYTDDSAFQNALWITRQYLGKLNISQDISQCLWAMEVDGQKLFIHFMKDLLEKRVVDEGRFIGILSKHAYDLVPCR